jgi:hypothetical protein
MDSKSQSQPFDVVLSRRCNPGEVAPLFQAVLTNLHQSRTIAILRDTLLPKLLSGEVAASKNEFAE